MPSDLEKAAREAARFLRWMADDLRNTNLQHARETAAALESALREQEPHRCPKCGALKCPSERVAAAQPQSCSICRTGDSDHEICLEAQARENCSPASPVPEPPVKETLRDSRLSYAERTEPVALLIERGKLIDSMQAELAALREDARRAGDLDGLSWGEYRAKYPDSRMNAEAELRRVLAALRSRLAQPEKQAAQKEQSNG